MKKSVFAAAALSVCVLLLSACGSENLYAFELKDLGNGVSFHTEAQSSFLAGNYNDIALYAEGLSEKSLPEAVRLEWQANPKDANAAPKEYIVELSVNSDFNSALTYTTAETQLDIYNLYLATDYYWRVTAISENGKKSVSKPSTFTTDSVAPRNLYVDGVTNVRDLGGWSLPYGRVRQGAIIRCGRLNESGTDNVNIEITQQGIDTMLNELNIKTEIDLRDPVKHNFEAGGITSSPLGESVNYISIPLEWNVNNLLTGNTGAVARFFEVIADEDNYPIIYHCNIGTDRTGLFALLINGLLGVSEDDLYRDYMFSNFGNIGGQRNVNGIANSYVKTIKNTEGADLSEKIKNYLLSIGVTQEQIYNLIYIMLK